MPTKKEYVWIYVKNPWANDWNNKPEKELRRYRVKEFKEKCVVLFNGKQYPYSQIVKRESEEKNDTQTNNVAMSHGV